MSLDSLLKRVFKNDADVVKKELSRDTKLKKFLLTYLVQRITEMETVPITTDNWAIKRAYADGQKAELEKLKSLLENS